MSKITARMIVHFVRFDIPDDMRWDIMTLRGSEAEVKVAVDKVKGVNGYVPVAAIEYDERQSLQDNLEHAYRITQNGVVTDSWTMSPPDGLMPLVDPIREGGREYGHRSMSVGDIVEYGGNQHVVASVGFKKVG